MRIFYDVDTQKDFMDKNGALYIPGAEEIKFNLEKLTTYTRGKYIPVIGSVDRHFGTEEYKHREVELKRWGGPFGDHCMAGTEGELKIEETLLWYPSDNPDYHFRERDIYIPHELDNSVDRALLGLGLASICGKTLSSKYSKNGLYFEKQNYDVFTNPAFKIFLEMADINEAVVYGVATDYCVRAAVLGMQNYGIQCYVVKDAIKGIAEETTKSFLEEMAKAGAKFVTTRDVLEEKI